MFRTFKNEPVGELLRFASTETHSGTDRAGTDSTSVIIDRVDDYEAGRTASTVPPNTSEEGGASLETCIAGNRAGSAFTESPDDRRTSATAERVFPILSGYTSVNIR